jgi:hypothetical protein
VQSVADSSVRLNGYRPPLAAICHVVQRAQSGRVIGPVTPPDIPKKILEGLQPAAYERIQAPALGIFNAMTPRYRLRTTERSLLLRRRRSIGASRRSRSGMPPRSAGSRPTSEVRV